MAGFPCRICARSREKLHESENRPCAKGDRGMVGAGPRRAGMHLVLRDSDSLVSVFLVPQVPQEEVGGGCRTRVDGGHRVRNVQQVGEHRHVRHTAYPGAGLPHQPGPGALSRAGGGILHPCSMGRGSQGGQAPPTPVNWYLAASLTCVHLPSPVYDQSCELGGAELCCGLPTPHARGHEVAV